MKIAILGTKGIPNNYGGFEQFAEYLSVGLVNLGHSVTVYNPNYHPYKESTYNGVTIQRIYNPENLIGSAANFIYDHLCLQHALKQGFDLIYEAGYHSVALSYWILGVRKIKNPVLLTNMDGLEWKRTKWNFVVKKLIKKLERITVRHSRYIVSDNIGIQEYYKEVFKKESFYLPYGADVPTNFRKDFLLKYSLEPLGYFILIARLEPENNIELIIKGFCNSRSAKKLVIVGGLNKYGNLLRKQHKDNRLLFVGGVYNKEEIDSLRYFSIGYFHGHSVGGTNPSLLEAMATSCFIMAHDNPFNRAILEESACYFLRHENITNWVDFIEINRKKAVEQYMESNIFKIKNLYSWKKIVNDHEALFKNILNIN
jgi:glycosyltransferase involved in cell wall biosynthesis